jgi:uncharacterized membrane protein
MSTVSEHALITDRPGSAKIPADRPGPFDASQQASQPAQTKQPSQTKQFSQIKQLKQLSAVLAAAGVLAQICCPLLSGGGLRTATVLSVVLLAGAAVTHAAGVRGRRAAVLLLVIAGAIGLLAETVGVHTGFPFGDYAYTGRLGPRLFGVPLIVPLAWTMLAYPCLLLGRRLAARIGCGRRVFTVITTLTGAIALAGWDLYLDPQMVAQGNWSWLRPGPSLPGVPGVPLTNYAGWLLVSLVMITALDQALPRSRGPEVIPAVVLGWTWLGSAAGNLFFFDRPWVALYGALAMGVVTAPYLLLLSGYSRHERTGTRR